MDYESSPKEAPAFALLPKLALPAIPNRNTVMAFALLRIPTTFLKPPFAPVGRRRAIPTALVPMPEAAVDEIAVLNL